ncbi:MAG TPA: S9 family peptidase [Candidatus Baltobacteraceae bacterium]|jgi:dipeptidyl aminopeptidase/acylaminoacyl peptidase
MRVGRSLCCCFLVAAAFLAGPVIAAGRGLTFADLRRVASVRQPQISPDGKRVVYVRSRANFVKDRNQSELVLLDVASGASRVLTHDRIGATSPAWSPDGSSIAYVASATARKPGQIYVLRMDGGDSERITNAKTGIDSFAWRPDGKALAYVSDEEPPDKAAIDRHLDAVVITDDDYLTREAAQPAHLWTVNADGSSATRLAAGSWSVVKDAPPLWSPDGSRIYYQRQPDGIFAHFVAQTTYVHDFRAKTDLPLGVGVDGLQDVSHDGSMLALAMPRHGSLYLQSDLSVRSSADGRELFNSRGIDRNLHWAAWLPGDKSLAVATSDGVRNVLWTLASDGSSHRVDLGDVDFAPDATVARDGAIAFVGLRRDREPEIYYLPPGGSTPRLLSDDNAWLGGFQLGNVERIDWKIDNGMMANGVLTYPVGYVAGKRYPLVLDIHGGPVSTSTWDLSGIEAGELDQVLAARGYLVLRPNYRGSDNEGDAFLQAIVGDVTSGPGRDNLAAVDAVRKMGIVDEKRIGVSGWSGGGLQTSWLIGHATFWRAAVSGAAVDDWYQQAMLADINENFAETFFNGVRPFDAAGRKAYAAESPIAYVNAIRTPTLILSDTRDQRVPVAQSYVFYHALHDRGVPVRFTAFPRYGHFPTDPAGREQALRAWADWFDRWMK